jgi:hypothetical protein
MLGLNQEQMANGYSNFRQKLGNPGVINRVSKKIIEVIKNE